MARSESFTNRPNTLSQTILLIRTFRLQSGGGPYIAQRGAVATHSLGDWIESAEGDHSLPGGRSPHLLRGAQRILERRARVRRAGVS
jgi:hypothetical protein